MPQLDEFAKGVVWRHILSDDKQNFTFLVWGLNMMFTKFTYEREPENSNSKSDPAADEAEADGAEEEAEG